MLAGVDARVPSGAWHTLGIAVRDDRFTIVFDGRELFGATDATFRGPGRIGLCTKADSVTWFESIKIKSLDRNFEQIAATQRHPEVLSLSSLEG